MDVCASPEQPMRSFLDPAVCFICEQGLTALQHATRIVDTAQDYWEKNPAWARLSGRKYVCEGCVHHIASALGYVTLPVHTAAKDRIVALESQVAELTKLADVSGVLKSAVDAAVKDALAKPKAAAK